MELNDKSNNSIKMVKKYYNHLPIGNWSMLMSTKKHIRPKMERSVKTTMTMKSSDEIIKANHEKFLMISDVAPGQAKADVETNQY